MHQSSVINQSNLWYLYTGMRTVFSLEHKGNVVNEWENRANQEEVNMSRNLLDRLGVSLACLESRSEWMSCFE